MSSGGHQPWLLTCALGVIFGLFTTAVAVEAASEPPCHGEDCADSQDFADASLLQRKGPSKGSIDAFRRGGVGFCDVGDPAICPGSGMVCAGNSCCPGVNGADNFPCPSASKDFAGCGSDVKLSDCTKVSTRLGSRDTVPNSIYFALVDRFGRTDGNDERCDSENGWCGGTLRGIINELDYIQGMGFEAVWITPVVKQYPGETPSGTGAMGYWAYDLYEIDPHFGTPQDLWDLTQDLHARGMVLVYDFVANHMGPIHNEEMVSNIVPFGEPSYYHQLFRGNLTFTEYTNRTVGWPPPAQAMWSQSGAQCTQGADCSCYKCVKADDLGRLGGEFGGCDGTWQFIEGGQCPEGALSKYCMPGDLQCKGYNETITWEGWFYDLGDLNQTDPYVRRTQLDWIQWFVQEYDIDYLRLDTAAFMSWSFLSELQDAAGVSIMGEVTTTNLTFHAQFQTNPPTADGQVTLDGVLNFPLYYTATSAFCGDFWPFSTFNLTFLGERMTEQLAAPYRSVERLGNFLDNHDTDRITRVCKKDMRRITNALVWVMMTKGTPIIYYGTEQWFMSEHRRESLWQTGYSTEIDGYKFLKQLNLIRGRIPAVSRQVVIPTADRGGLAFVRDNKVVVLVNNLESGAEPVRFCNLKLPHLPATKRWVNALTNRPPLRTKSGCFLGTDPVILVQHRRWPWSPKAKSQLAEKQKPSTITA